MDMDIYFHMHTNFHIGRRCESLRLSSSPPGTNQKPPMHLQQRPDAIQMHNINRLTCLKFDREATTSAPSTMTMNHQYSMPASAPAATTAGGNLVSDCRYHRCVLSFYSPSVPLQVAILPCSVPQWTYWQPVGAGQDCEQRVQPDFAETRGNGPRLVGQSRHRRREDACKKLPGARGGLQFLSL